MHRREHRRRQDQVAQAIDERAVADGGAAGGGQPSQAEREDQLQHQAEPEHWQRQPRERQCGMSTRSGQPRA